MITFKIVVKVNFVVVTIENWIIISLHAKSWKLLLLFVSIVNFNIWKPFDPVVNGYSKNKSKGPWLKVYLKEVFVT